MFTKLIALAFLAGSSTLALAQSLPTASRRADLQLGVSASITDSDHEYNGVSRLHGYGFYGDLDVREHLGLEFDFHQNSGPDPVLYERTYEIGPRYVYPIGRRFAPYAKAMYGRGVFNFPGPDANGNSVQIANLAYNIYTFGGGLDLKVLPGLNVRAFDFEYQRWPGFPPHALSPLVVSFGVAYHFHGAHDLRRK